VKSAAVIVLATVVAACNPSSGAAPRAEAPAKTWPPGTVLAVDDLAVGAEEVDAVSVYTERIEPHSSAPQLRRLALTNVVLPRALSRLMAPEAREKARQEANAKLASLKRNPPLPPPNPDGAYGEIVTAGFTQLGIVPWGVAMDLEDDAWSDVIEEVGRFVIIRRIARIEGALPMATRFKVDVLAFPWLPIETMRGDIEAEHDKHKLTIVDPTWSDIVPELIKHRMGVHAS
jgi:hypothetical protein